MRATVLLSVEMSWCMAHAIYGRRGRSEIWRAAVREKSDQKWSDPARGARSGVEKRVWLVVRLALPLSSRTANADPGSTHNS